MCCYYRSEVKVDEKSHETEDRVVYQPWTPTGYTAFKALLSARLCAAIWSNISDCDETYNFWEPVNILYLLPRSKPSNEQSYKINLQFVLAIIFVDALPATRFRLPDLGVFSDVRHPVVCISLAVRIATQTLLKLFWS